MDAATIQQISRGPERLAAGLRKTKPQKSNTRTTKESI
jgi:hypothetical protein